MSIEMPRSPIGRVPLPNEIPPSPELDQIPVSVLHKSTVEYLLSQNQDLMSRLGVNIRRIAELESRLQEREESLKVAADQADFVTSELQVTKEQARRAEMQLSQTRTELALTEKRMSDHFASSSTLRDALEKENRHLREDLFHMQNYRRRIREQVRPMVDRLKNANEALDAKAFRLEVEKHDLEIRVTRQYHYRRRIKQWVRPMVRQLRDALKYFEGRQAELERIESDLKGKLAAAYAQNQRQQQDSKTEQAQLVDHYERRHAESRKELEKINRDLEYYKNLSDQLAKQVENFATTQTLAENRAIESERRYQSLEGAVKQERQAHLNERTLLNEEVKRLAEELRHKTSELATTKRALLHSEERLQVIEMENRELRAQLSALQALWDNNMQQLKDLHSREISLAAKAVQGSSTSDVRINPPEAKSVKVAKETVNKIENFLNELQAAAISQKFRQNEPAILEEMANAIEKAAVAPPAVTQQAVATPAPTEAGNKAAESLMSEDGDIVRIM